MTIWERLNQPIRFRAQVQEFHGGKDARLGITGGKNTDFPSTNRTVEVIDEDSEAGSRSNFRKKRDAVSEIKRQYRGMADWGNQLVKNITNYRIGMVFPQGVGALEVKEQMQGQDEAAEDVAIPTTEGTPPVTPSTDVASPEFQFILDKVIRFNKLDGPGATKHARLRELEGQCAVNMRVVEGDDGTLDGIALDLIPWSLFQYQVIWNTIKASNGKDVEVENAGLDKIVIATDDDEDDDEGIVFEGDSAAFIAFDALDDGKEGVPTLMGNIQETIDIDKSLADLREGNQYFGKPSPVFEAKSTEEAKRLSEILTGETRRNLKLTHYKIVHGEFKLVSMDLSGTESLISEILIKAKMISGGTGVPLQHIGLPEFISNRGGLENTMEPVANFASTEQEIWETFYQEIFDKSIALANEFNDATSTKLETGTVVPVLSTTTQRMIGVLKEILLPMAMQGQYAWKALRLEVPSNIDKNISEEMLEEQRREEGAMTLAATRPVPPPISIADRVDTALDSDVSVLDEEDVA